MPYLPKPFTNTLSIQLGDWVTSQTTGVIVAKVFLPANGTAQITPRSKLKLATADKKLFLDASVSGNVACTVWYYSEA